MNTAAKSLTTRSDLPVSRINFLNLGSVYSANLDGSGHKTLLIADGNLTGIAYVELPAAHAAPGAV